MTRPRGARLAGALVVLALVSGCTVGREDPAAGPGAASPSAPSVLPMPSPTGPLPESAAAAVAQTIMTKREQAVRNGDRKAFLDDLDPGNKGLIARQGRLFDNLVQLPLEAFSITVTDDSYPADFAAPRFRETAYVADVDQRLQLRGFDSAPARTLFGLTLAPVDGRWRIVSDRDVTALEVPGARDAPWDLDRIVVRRSRHVLGVFDKRSARSSDRIMRWTEESIRRVRRDVPREWGGTVVIYALSRDRVLRTLGKRFLDRAAVAFPVLNDNERPTSRVATRVVMNPAYLPRTEREGTYLLTHEITHVALARTSGHTPAWLQEGLADYIASSGGRDWYVGAASRTRARNAPVGMPASDTFGDRHALFEYDVSLAACVYLADRFGERRLWSFLREMTEVGRDRRTPESDQDRVLRRLFGIDSDRLAQRAADLVVQRAGG